ncbi:potassium-transporting ATPase subunit KdpA [Arthrobacter sp. FW306-04-A]|uniref:potassium-transporting ATPase subunit KdpA n=1 Tax=Arthrobacter sp. FW306-04-A TaxID=2879619 RepID=UPI0037BF8530|nr:potassium-transporting ATPase subunit KdpA [Arthrobacter sp. FW306-04-A]
MNATNTNWQTYIPEATVGIFVQMCLLAVQNFLSAAVGIVVVVALIRGIARTRTDRLGNFWVDLARISLDLFVRNPEKLITQQQLLGEVWGPAYAKEANYLRVYMAQLRRKLEPEPGNPRHLITEVGIGYRFMP